MTVSFQGYYRGWIPGGRRDESVGQGRPSDVGWEGVNVVLAGDLFLLYLRGDASRAEVRGQGGGLAALDGAHDDQILGRVA
jgi:hypothetical protein